MGKTRLVREFAARAEAQYVRVAFGHCYGVSGAPPYFPFQQVMEALGSVGPVESSDSFWGSAGIRHAPLENQEGDPREWRERFLTEVSGRLMGVAATQPVALIIEDIHWADASSLLLLNALVDRRGHGLLVISTVRPGEPLEGPHQRLVYALEAKSVRLSLQRLTPAEIAEMVTGLCSAGFATQLEVEFLHRFTRGNPLFVREVLNHLKHEGILESDSIQEGITKNRIPLRLAGLLDMRLATLPSGVREVLAEASVLGDEFSAVVLSCAKQESVAVVEDLLEVAVRRGILEPARQAVAPRFRFAHPLYRKRLYESFAPSLRRAFHSKVARAAIAREVDLPAEEQAVHFAGAGEKVLRRQAISSCRRAAIKAEMVCAYETAAWFWELALQCGSSRRRRESAALLTRLGWARWAAREWPRAKRAWQEAIELYEALRESEPIGTLALVLGEMARYQQDIEEAEYWLKRALSLLPSRSKARARALAMLGSAACLRSQSAEGMALLEEARQASTSEADPFALYWLSYGYLTVGDAATARAVAEEAFTAAQETGDRYIASHLAGYLAQIDLSFLRFHDASRYAAFLRRTVEPSNMIGLSFLLICESLLAAYRGQWKRVVRICDRRMGDLRLGGRYQFAAGRFFRAEAKLRLGEAGAACAEMAQSLPDLEQMRPAAALHLARALLPLGRVDEARRLVRVHSAALLDTQRMAAGRAILGEVAVRLGDRPLAEQVYRILATEKRPLLMLYSPVSVQRVLGLIAARLQEWPKALEHFETAVEELSKADALGELLPTYLDYAQVRRARRRRGDLTKALALEARAADLLARLSIPVPASPTTGGSVDGHDTYGNRFALTGRELQVLGLVAEGRRNAEIADALSISDRTVERHLENIMAKMGVGGRVEAVVRALEDGLLEASHPSW